MPRGPFQGTWQQGVRPTVTMAPDALVYINGQTEIIGCPSCNRTFDIHKYLTSVQVDLNIDGPGSGSASLSLSVPRHAIEDFYFEGVPVIQPMMEVEIFAKGYFLVEGVPQYYPIFWGLVTEVDDGYSSGEQTININCADILKWWELCKMNVNAAFTAATGQMGRSIFGNVFFGTNPYDVIWSLAQSAMGDVVRGAGSLTSMSKESTQTDTFMRVNGDMALYWTQRFSRITNNLLLYGVNGQVIRGDSLMATYKQGKGSLDKIASRAVQQANGGPENGQAVFDPTSSQVVAFKTQFGQAGQVNFWQSEYQSKLELANSAKEAIGFEFYMDVDGSIVFKPPFYNLDTLPNKPVSWIQDIDIIDWNFSESEAEVITQVQMSGSFGGNIDYSMPADVEPQTSVTDYHLLLKYGWRTKPVNSEFLGDPMLMFYHGLDILDVTNSKRHRGTVTIPCRPELRLGFPIYVAPKDQMWYVSGISHNISFGGRATTTLTLTARRGKFFAPKGIGQLILDSVTEKNKPGTANNTSTAGTSGVQSSSTYKWSSRQLAKGGKFTLKVGEAAQMPPNLEAMSKPVDSNPYAPLVLRHPRTGRAVGYPNVVMAYTRPFTPAPDDLKQQVGQGGKTKAFISKDKQKEVGDRDKANDQYLKQLEVQLADEVRSKYMQNRYQYGLNSAGVFTYLHDTKKVIAEVLLAPTTNFTMKDANGAPAKLLQGEHSMVRPVSDDRGFEVIGHFRYGRGLQLRDGRLVRTDEANAPAQISVQTALSGDLYATLAAQSQGLTTLSTSYPNPAASLANLAPDPDLQTAGIINDKGQPEFVDSAPNFVDTAPLGSPERAKFPTSVEASQLSKALTLAEMTVKMDGATGSDTCGCILGRPDLAFLASGYQVQLTDTTAGTTPDASTLFDQYSTFSTTDRAAGVAVIGGSEDLGRAQGGGSTTGGARPVAPSLASSASSPEEMASKINQILFDLYQVLDTPHQQWEEALRGANVPPDPRSTEDIMFGQPTDQPVSPLSPPYSAPDRFAVGDPNAIAEMGQSNKANLTQSWTDFSKNLKAAAKPKTP